MEEARLASAFKVVLNYSSSAIMVLDRNKTILAFNAIARGRVEELYGVEMAAGDSAHVFVSDDSWPIFERDFEQALMAGSLVVECPIPSRHGDDHPFRYSLTAISEPGAPPWGICFAVEDVGPLRAVQQNLAKRESQYFELLRTLPVVVLIVVDERYRYGNEAALAMFGLSRLDELVGLEVRTFIPPEDLAKSRERLNSSQKGSVNGERAAEIVRLDGSRRKLMVQSLFCSYEGRDASLVIARDVTEEVKRELWMKMLSYAVEQSPACIVITDTHGSIEYTNPQFSEITGYSADEARGKNPRILKSGEMSAVAYDQLWQTISNGGVWRGEFHNVKRNGELYWEDASIGPIRNSAGKIVNYIAVKEIVTQRKHDEAVLREALSAKEALIHELHHRTRNNLQILSALLSMQVERSGESDACDALEAIRGRIMALAAVQDQVLDRDNLSRIDLGSFVDDLFAQILGEYTGSSVHFITKVEIPQVEVSIDFANPFGLVINELVSNSIRFAFPGRAAGSMSLIGRKELEALEFVYQDDGIGLPAGFSLKHSDTLGFVIISSMIEAQLGGTVSILPGPGFGCRLRVPF
jgi:PAS domain S-box-containing protein